MDLSVAIINYKTPDKLKTCLESLNKYHPELESRIVVIDNNSQDESVDLVRNNFPKVKVVPSRTNSGFAIAANWGINNSQTEHVLIINPDVFAIDQSLKQVYNHLIENEDIAIIAPKLLLPGGSRQFSCFRDMTPMMVLYRRTFLGLLPFAKNPLNRFLMKDVPLDRPSDVDWLAGGCLMVRKEAIRKVGLMDENFFMYFEDTDWCRRFREAGYRVVYYPEAQVIHHHRRQSADQSWVRAIFQNRTARIHIKSGIRYFLKKSGLIKYQPENLTEYDQNTNWPSLDKKE